MSGQVSRGSAGEYQTDDQAGVAGLPSVYLMVCPVWFMCKLPVHMCVCVCVYTLSILKIFTLIVSSNLALLCFFPFCF